MSEPVIRSFEEFWPYYVKAHSKKATRTVHFLGTTAAVALLGTGVLTRRLSLVALAPVVGYGAAWISHFFIEGNKPATFGHPLWSLKADFVMWKKIVDGTMDGEVERICGSVDGKVESKTEVASEPIPVPTNPGDATVN